MSDQTTFPLQISKVGIIGFGISGIAAAKQLREYNPVVLEATDSTGGVWRHCCFRSTMLQTPRRGFEFSDYHWPAQRDRQAISKFIESYLLWKLPLLKYGLKPDHLFEEDYASCQMAILPENFFTEVEKGKIQLKRASEWWFWRGGIEFEDNTKLDADVVILATGYDSMKKLQLVLPEPFKSSVVDSSGAMPLYRGSIHPLIPNMAFMGYVETELNLRISELRSMWLARLAAGRFSLPSPTEMLQQVREEMEVKY